MDKKNTLIGLLFIGLALFMIVRSGKEQAEQMEKARIAAAEQALAETAENAKDASATATTATLGAAATKVTMGTAAPAATASAPERSAAQATGEGGLFSRPAGSGDAVTLGQGVEPAITDSAAAAQTYVLQNDYIRVTFTSRGGAIAGVAFVEKGVNGGLRYPETVDSDVPYTFNAGAQTPALALGLPNDGRDSATRPVNDYLPQFTLEQKTDTAIAFSYEDANGGRIFREYTIEAAGVDNQPYLVAHVTRLQNTGAQALNLPALFLNVGSVPPTEGDYMSQYLNFGYYNAADEDAEFLQLYRMKGVFGLFGAGDLQAQAPRVQAVVENGEPQVEWASIKNQFFATVLTPKGLRGNGIFATSVSLEKRVGANGAQMPEIGATGALRFDLGELAPGETKSVEAGFYCGPKEYLRLTKLGEHQDEVMQFGYMGAISKMLLWALVGIHNVVVHVSPEWAWGWAIIILTIIIKAVLWPLTQVQVRSSKRMAKIQKPMAELREKYKDNPQKMNQEMMKLWKEHRVNPLAGCLPILVQFPIFIGLFFMLRTASELRFAPFLWVQDLSAPEHLFSWGVDVPFLGEYFNLLPILMGVTMFFQMRMTPTPTTDNMQRKIFQFMPFIFLLFCYRFPSGLVIYWTGQNLISILQQWITNRRKDDDLPVAAPAAASPKRKGGGAPRTAKKRKA